MNFNKLPKEIKNKVRNKLNTNEMYVSVYFNGYEYKIEGVFALNETYKEIGRYRLTNRGVRSF